MRRAWWPRARNRSDHGDEFDPSVDLDGNRQSFHGGQLRRSVMVMLWIALLVVGAYGAIAGLDFLSAEGIAPERLVLYGESLGSGVATVMASERPVGALLLESPYSSITAVAQRRYPYVPVGWLLKDRFDSLTRIGLVRAPILILQGARDRLVPPDESRKLVAAASDPKELSVAPEASHNDMTEFGAVDAAIAYIKRQLPA